MTRLPDILPTEGPAVSDRDGLHDWRALHARAARVGAGIAAASDEPQPRIGLLMAPSARWLATLLGIWHAGGIAVPLSPKQPTREVEQLLTEADARMLLVDEALAHPTLCLPQREPESLEARPGAPARASELSLLLFTSGTTGRPKGAMISHLNLGHQARLLAEAWRLDEETNLLHTLPLHHMHGIAIALLPVLAAGGQATFSERFDPQRVWRSLTQSNTFMAVPTIYARLLEAFDAEPAERDRRAGAARALRLATSGSAPLPASLAARWEEISGVIPLERYGMTEVGVACSNPFEPSARRRATVGQPLATVELRLDDSSEIWIRGPSVFGGYWRRPDATAAAFEEGWFRTGDVGIYEEGYLRLRGRRSVDILKSGGEKISALEVEEVLRAHPAVREVAVIGLADPIWGQRVVAAGVLTEGADPEAVRAWAKNQLAAYKVPKAIVPLDSLPRNALGKVQKAELVRLLSG